MSLTEQELERRREREAPHWLIVAWGAILVFSIIHTVRTRSLDQIIGQSRPIGLALFALLLAVLAVTLFADRSSLSRANLAGKIAPALIAIAFLALTCMFMGAMFYALGVSVHDVYIWARESLALQQRSQLRLAMVVVLPLAAAILLFSFRLGFRSIYGVSEAVVGFWVGLRQFDAVDPAAPIEPTLVMTILTASVYLMVRGFDNIHQGLTKDPKDPVATAVLAWLRKPWRP